jgi:hypothetical protein
MNGLVFGYKISRKDWSMLINAFGEFYFYDTLCDHIYEFKDYVIIGCEVIANANDATGIAYGIDEINAILLEKKEDIDNTLKEINNCVSLPYKLLPQVWFIHLAELE